MKKLLPTLAFICILVGLSCGNNKEEPQKEDTIDTSMKIDSTSTSQEGPVPFIGFWGNEGIKQNVIFNDDQTFVLETFRMEDNEPLTCVGTWKLKKDSIHTTIYCQPEAQTSSLPINYTYNSKDTTIIDEQGEVYSQSFDQVVQRPVDPPQSITDFFALLPEQYITFFSSYHEYYHFDGHKNFAKTVDLKNGYIADDPMKGSAQFEMALFRKEDGSYLIVVSNRQDSGTSLTVFDTYFLTYEHSTHTWTDIEEEVLPELKVDHFFSDPEVIEIMENAEENNIGYSYRFELPRKGTVTKVSLEVEQFDYDDPVISKVLDADQNIVKLIWNRKTGKFELEPVGKES